MGHPKRQKKKYDTPLHPWDAGRIEEERDLVKDYGLKNKKEIWKAETILRDFKRQIKNLIARRGEKQAIKEEKDLRGKLLKLGLINADASLENVLGLTMKDILDRRLQSIVLKQGLARTISQARQFIVHGHIFVKDQKINVPSYLVLKSEENAIRFDSDSKLADIEHPERIAIKKEKSKVLKPIKGRRERGESRNRNRKNFERRPAGRNKEKKQEKKIEKKEEKGKETKSKEDKK